MTTTNTRPGSTSEVIGAGLTGTARTTGLLYLGLAVTGALGFQLVRGQLYVAGDPGGRQGPARSFCGGASAGPDLACGDIRDLGELGVVAVAVDDRLLEVRMQRRLDGGEETRPQ